MTDVDRKTKNIVVRCLRPYKGYGLLREMYVCINVCTCMYADVYIMCGHACIHGCSYYERTYARSSHVQLGLQVYMYIIVLCTCMEV